MIPYSCTDFVNIRNGRQHHGFRIAATGASAHAASLARHPLPAIRYSVICHRFSSPFLPVQGPREANHAFGR